MKNTYTVIGFNTGRIYGTYTNIKEARKKRTARRKVNSFARKSERDWIVIVKNHTEFDTSKGMENFTERYDAWEKSERANIVE